MKTSSRSTGNEKNAPRERGIASAEREHAETRFRLPRRRAAVLAGLVLGLLGGGAEAITIDFENYDTGELVGQPPTGTKWTNSKGSFVVADGIGVAGGKAVQMTSTATQYSSANFTPSAADLGGSIDTDRLYLYSFDAKIPYASGTFFNIWVGRILSPSSYISRISISSTSVTPASGYSVSGVINDHQWHRFSGEIDFKSHTYSFAVDGTTKFTSIPFGSGTQDTFGYFSLNVQTTYPADNTIYVDNVFFEVKPWPDGTLLTVR